jgi:hypothetical protein
MLPLTANDIVTVLAFTAFSVSNTYTQAEANARFVQNTNTVAAGKNAIINGGFDVWQRGTSFIGAGYNYTADRFLCFRASFAAGMTITRQASAQEGFQYALRTQRDSGNTSTLGLSTIYALETVNSLQFAGKTVTVSFYARAGANYSGGAYTCAVFSGTGTDQATVNLGSWTNSATIGATNATLTTTFQRFSFSFTVGSTATQLGFNLGWTPTGTAGANDWVEVTGIQLELGSVATTFTRTGGTIANELAACQRYYQRFNCDGSNFAYFGHGAAQNSGSAFIIVTLKETMRVAPTSLDLSTLTNYFAENSGVTSVTNLTSITLPANVSTKDLAMLQVDKTSSFTVGAYYRLVSNNNTNAYIGLSAEL